MRAGRIRSSDSSCTNDKSPQVYFVIFLGLSIKADALFMGASAFLMRGIWTWESRAWLDDDAFAVVALVLDDLCHKAREAACMLVPGIV